MSVIIHQDQPGFVDVRMLERSVRPDGNITYFIVLGAKPDAQINVGFGPISEDEDEL